MGVMLRQTFPYLLIDVKPTPAFPLGYSAYRPCATVSIGRGDRRTVPFTALIDTGADHCLFPIDYLDVLGIEQSSLTSSPMHGTGQDLNVLFAYVALEIQDFGEWLVYAGFSEQWRNQHVGFLGYSGFLDRLVMHADGEKRICELDVP